MARATLKLEVIEDTCLGHGVFRGSSPAGTLVDACWIDFHDTKTNPVGYQRPFNQRRSRQAADYAENTDGAFWPECIMAMRDDGDEEDANERVRWNFKPARGTGGRYGTLEVSYIADQTTLIEGKQVAWRRAFSQVDCQHRLGSMANSEKLVTFCIFPGLSRREEAIIFRTINAKQKAVSTSLVDSIIYHTDPDAPAHIKWAWDLGIDSGSPLNGQVWTGGRGRPPATHLINLAGLRTALQVLVPRRYLDPTHADLWYVFVRNFWKVIKSLWPREFADRANYKLQTVPGQRGLAQFGQHVFRKVIQVQDTRQRPIREAFANDGSRINWRNDGPFELATGKGGQREVYRALVDAYGLPA